MWAASRTNIPPRVENVGEFGPCIPEVSLIDLQRRADIFLTDVAIFDTLPRGSYW